MIMLQNAPKTDKPKPKKSNPRLTDRQKAFFKCLEEERYNINRVMMLLKIREWLMDRWFKDPLFLAVLKIRFRQVEFRTHMEMTYQLPLAAMNLLHMTNGFDTDTQLRACINILRFHHNSRSVHKYAFMESDGPGLPKSKGRPRSRFPKVKETPHPEDPAAALSRFYLHTTDADDYKRCLQLEARLEERGRLAETEHQPDA